MVFSRVVRYFANSNENIFDFVDNLKSTRINLRLPHLTPAPAATALEAPPLERKFSFEFLIAELDGKSEKGDTSNVIDTHVNRFRDDFPAN